MSVETAHNLARIADTLGVPAGAFARPPRAPGPAAVVAMLADPDGARLAAAFLRLPPRARAGLAVAIERVAAALAEEAGQAAA